jgi:hypothetical protein
LSTTCIFRLDEHASLENNIVILSIDSDED